MSTVVAVTAASYCKSLSATREPIAHKCHSESGSYIDARFITADNFNITLAPTRFYRNTTPPLYPLYIVTINFNLIKISSFSP